jgi:DNA-binding NarL/FixJ family response regulator
MNGIHPVKDDLMNQVAVEKAKQRALVKAVAIRYGLGFNVWAKDEIDDDSDDLYKHNLKSIEERVQQIYTRLIRKGMTTNEIAQALNKTPDEVKTIFTFFAQLDRFEQDLTKLL